jgi:hypothetical protein
MRKLMLGTALCVALGLPFFAEAASAKTGDPAQRSVCRLVAAEPPLKLLDFTTFVERLSAPSERLSRRANYTPVPRGVNGKERPPLLVSLDRQSKPTSLMVGVGF